MLYRGGSEKPELGCWCYDITIHNSKMVRCNARDFTTFEVMGKQMHSKPKTNCILKGTNCGFKTLWVKKADKEQSQQQQQRQREEEEERRTDSRNLIQFPVHLSLHKSLNFLWSLFFLPKSPSTNSSVASFGQQHSVRKTKDLWAK